MIYICGTPAMVDGMEKLLKELNIPAAQIRMQNFPAYSEGALYSTAYSALLLLYRFDRSSVVHVRKQSQKKK